MTENAPVLRTATIKSRAPVSHNTAADHALTCAIERARDAILQRQAPDGHWLYELEADCTIPAEYILMMHFLDEIDLDLEGQLAAYLRARQAEHGGWPLYYGGALDMSCTVKVYYALKLAGDSEQSVHMTRARDAILQRDGATNVNVFTRITLALFGQLPWSSVPYIPVEIVLLPRWSPLHLDKVSYWSRTVMVPLFILCTLKPRAANPRGVGVSELLAKDGHKERYFAARTPLGRMFLMLDRMARSLDRCIPGKVRAQAIKRAEQWTVERLNGEHGLGAIFPAMVNALEAFAVLGYGPNDPNRRIAKRALENLIVRRTDEAYCQPCVSPVWDTGLATLALQEEGSASAVAAAESAIDWLAPLQHGDHAADWRVSRPLCAPGGWAFQFSNDYYPDLDDTAVVAWAMLQSGRSHRHGENIHRAANWLAAMQSRNGGFAAFDVENTCLYLNEIPFADHGALLDPPTSDVTARVATLLSQVGRDRYRQMIQRAIAFLRNEQTPDGAWFGRWGTNYIYGTWSVLIAFAYAGIGANDMAVRRATSWLKSVQRPDGGWGESNDSYTDPTLAGRGCGSTPYQTAWALLGLLFCGETQSEAVQRGISYLMRTQNQGGLWDDPTFTAPGFPRVFYLKYHGYSQYFPLWALARYRNSIENERS